jgi:hypothetical protein
MHCSAEPETHVDTILFLTEVGCCGNQTAGLQSRNYNNNVHATLMECQLRHFLVIKKVQVKYQRTSS